MLFPLEKAHLSVNAKKDNNSLQYEALCVNHESIQVQNRSESTEETEVDNTMIDYLFEKPIEEWD